MWQWRALEHQCYGSFSCRKDAGIDRFVPARGRLMEAVGGALF